MITELPAGDHASEVLGIHLTDVPFMHAYQPPSNPSHAQKNYLAAIQKFRRPRPRREWAERLFNVQRWTQMPRGGHLAALEEPAALAEDIRTFFRPLRARLTLS